MNAITSILNKKAIAANSAANDALGRAVGDTINTVTQMGNGLRLGASNVMRLAAKAGNKKAGNQTKSGDDESEPKQSCHCDKKNSVEGKSKILDSSRPKSKVAQSLLHDANNQVRALKKQLMKTRILLAKKNAAYINLLAESDPKRQADQWAKEQIRKAATDANKFDGNMVKIKGAAKRKKISMAATGKLMQTEEMIGHSAKAARMADFLADRSVAKFMRFREQSLAATAEVPVLRKRYLKTKSEFEGFGPEMDPERARASQQARAAAAARKDAEYRFKRDKANYKTGVEVEDRLRRAAQEEGFKMMKLLQSALKGQRKNFEYRLMAEKFRTKAEIFRRTSCKDVKSQLTLATKSCECKNLGMWSAILGHDKKIMNTIKLKNRLGQCTRDVEACKFAYRKQGMVWMREAKKTTGLKYALTGKTKNYYLPSGNSTSKINPKVTVKGEDGFPTKTSLSKKDERELGQSIRNQLHHDVTTEDLGIELALHSDPQ